MTTSESRTRTRRKDIILTTEGKVVTTRTNEIIENLHERLSIKNLDAAICLGDDNFRYLTGTTLPFPKDYPEKQFAIFISPSNQEIIVPPELKQAVQDQNWTGQIHTYDVNKGKNEFLKTMSEIIREHKLENSRIGFDAVNTPFRVYENLEHNIPDLKLVPMDDDLDELKIIKKEFEVKLIENACEHIDRGIIHALNHLEGTLDNVGYTIPEYAERVRVHFYESGGSGVGDLSVTYGKDTQYLYTTHKGNFKESELFRTDISAHYLGYWSNLGRMGFIDEPTKPYKNAYKENKALKKNAIDLFSPGVNCNSIYSKISEDAKRKGIKLHSNMIGHGVGVSHVEKPYLNPYDSTELQAGMVIALDITTKGPKNEIIHDKDVYEITEKGSRKLSWYRDWDKIYAVTGFRSVH
jgi:Xaa-Pro aminopeptidase